MLDNRLINQSQNFWQQHWWPVSLVSIIVIYLLLTLPAFFAPHHLLANLEPYPDGLFYALTGRNLALGKELALSYQDNLLPLPIPPLYPLALFLGYLLSPAVKTFYLINVLLGTLSIIFLMKVVKQTTKSRWVSLLAGTVYLLHGYVLLLPIFPMTENLSLWLFIMVLFYGTKSKLKVKDLLLGFSFLLALMLTRYAVILIVLAAGSWLIETALTGKSASIKKISLGLGIGSLGLGVAILEWAGMSIIKQMINFGLAFVSQPPSRFFSFFYIPENMIHYTKVILGWPMRFLWFQFPFTSIVISALSVYGVSQHSRRWLLTLAAIAQFPLILVLKGADARYLILLIPVLTIGASWGVEFLFQKNLKLCAVVIFLMMVGLGWSQFKTGKYLISLNWLHRSIAWQFESIQHFNTFFYSSPGSTLITALPPFLIEAYQTSTYDLLPLSPVQEFLAKEQYVWGKNINYQNLASEYEARLKVGEKLFISNAYVTHQQQVIVDFEKLKSQFDFELMQSGCLESCNIYQLRLPKHPK